MIGKATTELPSLSTVLRALDMLTTSDTDELNVEVTLHCGSPVTNNHYIHFAYVAHSGLYTMAYIVCTEYSLIMDD